MSGSKIFHWESGNPDDCNESDFNEALKAYGWTDSNDSEIYNNLKAHTEIRLGKWVITVSNDFVIAQDLPNKEKQLTIATKKPSTPNQPSATELFSASCNDYRFQLKYTEKKGRQVLYMIKNPLTGNDNFVWDHELKELFKNSMPLSELISVLKKTLSCEFKPEHLDSIDIGTTDIKICRDDPGSPFRFESISQQQPPSTHAEREKDLVKNRDELKAKLQIASERVKYLEQETKQLEELRSSVEKQKRVVDELKESITKYEKMIQDYTGVKSEGQHTMKDEVDKKILFRVLVPELKRFFRDDLKPILKVNIESIEVFFKSLESITERRVSDLSHDELALLLDGQGKLAHNYQNTEPIQDLDRQLKQVASDSILYILSTPEQRKSDKLRTCSDMLKKFGMEPIFFEPGSKLVASEARFIDVKQTSFERGLCVETVSFGIRNLENNSIIYKADVILSR